MLILDDKGERGRGVWTVNLVSLIRRVRSAADRQPFLLFMAITGGIMLYYKFILQ